MRRRVSRSGNRPYKSLRRRRHRHPLLRVHCLPDGPRASTRTAASRTTTMQRPKPANGIGRSPSLHTPLHSAFPATRLTARPPFTPASPLHSPTLRSPSAPPPLSPIPPSLTSHPHHP